MGAVNEAGKQCSAIGTQRHFPLIRILIAAAVNQFGGLIEIVIIDDPKTLDRLGKSMLLNDSPVALEVRRQLLNIVEHTEPEKRVSEIENEESMIIEIGKAFASGDLMKFAEATQKYSGYLSRNLTEARKAIDDLNVECSSLQEMNAMLAEKSLVWEPRRTLNALVRAIAAAVFDHRYSQAWDRFYRELKYRTGINLTSRSAAKGGRVLDAVRDEEWPQLMKVIASLCYDYCIDVVHTDLLLAAFDGQMGGTAMTVQYAVDTSIAVRLIAPIRN